MKLKNALLISMATLGLVSCPVFAADTTTDAQVAPKHKMHHKMRHHRHHDVVATHTNYKGDYKGELMSVDTCPVNNWYTPAMVAMSQNVGRAVPTVGCDKPISFAGGIATDFHTFNLSQGYRGENNERLSLNDAYLNIFGNVNQYVKAFGSLSYSNASGTTSTNGQRSYNLAGGYSTVYPANTLTVEQAYVTFADMDSTPVFFKLGKQYADFNRYMIHPVERTMTQVLTESLHTSAELGFVTHMGLHGSLTAFDSPSRKTTENHSKYVYGAALGFDQPSDTLGWDAGIGYMSDMAGVNSIATVVGTTYVNRVGAAAAYAHVNSGPFSFGANYATALTSFNAADIATTAAGTAGAKPRALDLKAGYDFNAWNKNQNVYVGFQKSWQSAQVALPSSRWLVGYGVDVLPNTMVGAEFGHDVAYSVASSGSSNGNNSNTLGVRAAVKFG